MSIKAIKQFLDWCQEGDDTLPLRRDMFHERLQEVMQQMAELQNTMNTLKYKCWYYDTAMKDGTEENMKKLKDEDIPDELREYKV